MCVHCRYVKVCVTLDECAVCEWGFRLGVCEPVWEV